MLSVTETGWLQTLCMAGINLLFSVTDDISCSLFAKNTQFRLYGAHPRYTLCPIFHNNMNCINPRFQMISCIGLKIVKTYFKLFLGKVRSKRLSYTGECHIYGLDHQYPIFFSVECPKMRGKGSVLIRSILTFFQNPLRHILTI